jgi:hypothetical protein
MLSTLEPDPNVVTSLDNESLGSLVLQVVSDNPPSAHLHNFLQKSTLVGYPLESHAALLERLAEAWQWLVIERHLLPDTRKGSSGWVRLSASGRALLDASMFHQSRVSKDAGGKAGVRTEEKADQKVRKVSIPAMDASTLGALDTGDDLASLVETLIAGLTSSVTGERATLTEEEYRRIRNAVRSHPALDKLCPKYLSSCRRLTDAIARLRTECDGQDAEAGDYIADTLSPVLDAIDSWPDGAHIFADSEVIGQGGFGVVYKVKHPLLDMHFAVKVFAPAFPDGTPAPVDRFFQEAKILFNLEHPGIIRIHDVGIVSNNRPYLKMDYFDGISLNKALTSLGRFQPAQALTVISCNYLS